ncbi:MerR family transcriptional regulator [Bacillus sp. 03113]|uniref:MerR family transcriptional regulator n=1 Tax=Bacillus sp. 03113 TaxID=2578211 RepID=UPI00215C23C1|nr:MerR family transcriptional regulator [Bacillus sp. 03113]
MMNTNAVAKLLGVSPSTIQRWVKQFKLEMTRNELGHYLFTEEDISQLKQIQEQLHNGVSLHDISVNGNRSRKGTLKTSENDKRALEILVKMNELERKLNDKADSVVSYQLLHHRDEIEQLQKQMKKLSGQIEALEKKMEINKNIYSENLLVFDQTKPKKKIKRKNIISTFFSF